MLNTDPIPVLSAVGNAPHASDPVRDETVEKKEAEEAKHRRELEALEEMPQSGQSEQA